MDEIIQEIIQEISGNGIVMIGGMKENLGSVHGVMVLERDWMEG